ncbi:hypothetical protein EMPS_06663 [Entomortierella parvispora]|uniref:DUF4112 domain-containing protein n=1 Tax=Entomortierella parvispora TaxID=205924 RepID=A0A9P3LXY3_9FUNG|nr:hypothetical protein EMPS_06663 [Entomortierella parvispora]
MGKYNQRQQEIQMQQQGPATVVSIPPNGGQDMVLTHEQPAPKTSKFKSFFTRSKKAKVVLSERDAEILRKVKARAKLLDTGLNLGFAKIGLDPIIGLVPLAGDAITLMMAMNLIHTAQKADIPKELTSKMLFNVAVDFGCGLVPVLGDFADFLYKGNHRNAKLFEAFLYERAAAEQAAAEAEAASRRNVPTPVPTANPNTNGHTYVNMNGNNNSAPVSGHNQGSRVPNQGNYPPKGNHPPSHGNPNATAAPPHHKSGGLFGSWGSHQPRTATVSS